MPLRCEHASKNAYNPMWTCKDKSTTITREPNCGGAGRTTLGNNAALRITTCKHAYIQDIKERLYKQALKPASMHTYNKICRHEHKLARMQT